MATRLEQLQSRLQQYFDCETAVLTGAQEYWIGSRRMTRADLKDISDTIKYLENEIAREASKAAGTGRNRTIGIIPRDF